MNLTLKQQKEYDEAKDKINEALKIKSRTFLGLCKNEDCYNLRRDKSAYCYNCSNKK